MALIFGTDIRSSQHKGQNHADSQSSQHRLGEKDKLSIVERGSIRSPVATTRSRRSRAQVRGATKRASRGGNWRAR